MERLAAALTAFAAASPGPTQGPPPGTAGEPASPFRAEAHFEDGDAGPEAFAAAAQAHLDAVWNLALRHLGRPRGDAPARMTVHVYQKREEYEAVSENLGGPDPRVFPGFADMETDTAHLLVGETLWWEDGELVPWVVEAMCHEAMHLSVGAVRGRTTSFYPRWYIEGLAMWAEARISEREVEKAGLGSGLRDAFSAARARTLLKDGRVPKVAEMLLDRYGDLSRVDEYPINRVLFALLMEDHAEAMAAFLPKSLDLPVSPAVPQQLADLLRVEVGEDAWEGLDDDLHARILELAEDVPEQTFAPPADLRGRPGDPDYHPGSPQVRWASEVGRNRIHVTARVTVREAGANQADFVFGQHGDSWLRVCLAPGAGVLVLAREQEGEEPGGWEVLARSGEVPALKLGEPVRLKIAASGGSVRVDVEGRRAVTARTGRRPFRGRWGIGAPAGCRSSWKDVRVQ